MNTDHELGYFYVEIHAMLLLWLLLNLISIFFYYYTVFDRMNDSLDRALIRV